MSAVGGPAATRLAESSAPEPASAAGRPRPPPEGAGRIGYPGRFVIPCGTSGIGAELFDSEPASLVIPTLQRDPNTRDGVAFGISLDTFLDRRAHSHS